MSPFPWAMGGSIFDDRYLQSGAAKSRRRCHCGCKTRATRLGMANGVCLTSGCELFVRRWVRDGIMARRALSQSGEQK